MKIRSLYIDGFGKFYDWKPPRDFGKGLTVIVGPNEAGKTTLLEFIRRMLHGFPDGRKRNLNHYSPLNGGKVGGRLDVVGSDGQDYVIARSGTRSGHSITLADGTTAEGLTSQSLLGPLDQIFYENVCAIGLGELQELSTLRDDKVRDRLTAAGAGNLPIREVATVLKDSADDIYSVRGRTKRINGLMSELKEIGDSIRNVRAGQGEYDRVNEDIAREISSVRALEASREDVEERIAHMKALGQVWGAFSDWEESWAKLRDIPVLEPFPDDTMEELNQLEGDVQRLGQEYEDLSNECHALEEEIRGRAFNEELLGHADTIHAIERKVEQYRAQLNDLRSVEQDLGQQRRGLASTLKSIGGEWDEERIARFDTSEPARRLVKGIRDRLAKAERDCDEQRSKLVHAEEEVERSREDLSVPQRNRDSMGDVLDPSSAKERRDISYMILDDVKRIQELEGRHNSIRHERIRNADPGAGMRPAKAALSWPVSLVALSVILVLALGFMTEMLIVAGAIALILIAAMAAMFITGRKTGEDEDDGSNAQNRKEEESSASMLREIERECSERKRNVQSNAGSLGVEPPRAEAAAQGLVRAYEDAVSKAVRAADLDEMIGRERERFDRAVGSLNKAQGIMDGLISKRDEARAEWMKWCRERDLLETMDPDSIHELLARIDAANGRLSQIKDAEERMDRLSDEIRSFEKEVDAAIAACNVPLNDRTDIMVEGLIRLLRGEEDAKREHEKLIERLGEKQAMLKDRTARRDSAMGDLEAMLKDRDAATPDDYRDLVRRSRERNELEERIRAAESAIRRVSGEGRYHDYIEALQEYEPVKAELDIERKEGELDEIQAAIRESHQRIGTLKGGLSRIAGDDELTRLLSQEAELMEQVRQISRQWAVYTTASSLLEMAIETFERERQPEILREAQSFLSDITGGKYARVVSPIDGSEPYVEEVTGARKGFGDLSRGTAEQLYLALRFGYIRDYVSSSAPVPVIFDDILVNFDPERRRNACRAIAELAEACQVIYFTCHPQTAQDLAGAMPDAVVMNIS